MEGSSKYEINLGDNMAFNYQIQTIEKAINSMRQKKSQLQQLNTLVAPVSHYHSNNGVGYYNGVNHNQMASANGGYGNYKRYGNPAKPYHANGAHFVGGEPVNVKPVISNNSYYNSTQGNLHPGINTLSSSSVGNNNFYGNSSATGSSPDPFAVPRPHSVNGLPNPSPVFGNSSSSSLYSFNGTRSISTGDNMSRSLSSLDNSFRNDGISFNNLPSTQRLPGLFDVQDSNQAKQNNFDNENGLLSSSIWGSTTSLTQQSTLSSSNLASLNQPTLSSNMGTNIGSSLQPQTLKPQIISTNLSTNSISSTTLTPGSGKRQYDNKFGLGLSKPGDNIIDDMSISSYF